MGNHHKTLVVLLLQYLHLRIDTGQKQMAKEIKDGIIESNKIKLEGNAKPRRYMMKSKTHNVGNI
jgi:hypothetical protein